MKIQSVVFTWSC